MAADPLVPVKTPFNYNLGINYETWENGRTGRSITADLDAITKNFGLFKTFHDEANPGAAQSGKFVSIAVKDLATQWQALPDWEPDDWAGKQVERRDPRRHRSTTTSIGASRPGSLDRCRRRSATTAPRRSPRPGCRDRRKSRSSGRPSNAMLPTRRA